MRGGLVLDRPSADSHSLLSTPTDGTNRTIGLASQHESGPLDTGGETDQHHIGADADAHQINALHLSTNALFRRSDEEDAPLAFEFWQRSIPGPHPIPVHLGLDANASHPFVCGSKKGLWKWFAESHIYTCEPPKFGDNPKGGDGGGKHIPPERIPPIEDPSGEGKIPPIKDPKFPPIETPTGSTWRKYIQGKFIQSTTLGEGAHLFSAMTTELAIPALLGRPQIINSGARDLRNMMFIDETTRREIDRTSPITYRLEAFGKQANMDWVYSQKPALQKYPGGTVQGGFVLLPPEIGMEDAPAFAPDGITLSTPSFIAHPSTTFAAGLPDLTTGKVKTGYKWGADTAGELIWNKVTSLGSSSEALRLDVSANLICASDLKWKSGTSFLGSFLHNNTVNRDYTAPDKSGTLALTSDTWTPVIKVADETIILDATLHQDNALVFPVISGNIFHFRGVVFFDTTAAADFQWRLFGPGTPSLLRLKRSWILPGDTAYNGIKVDTAYSGGGIPLVSAGTNGGYVQFEGILIENTSGNVKFQWAQNTSDVGNTTVLAGSYIEYRDVSLT